VDDDFDVQFTLPSSLDVTKGEYASFAVQQGKSPKTTDLFMLESASGISEIYSIATCSATSFSVDLSGCETGEYRVSIKRDTRKKSFGKIYINIVEKLQYVTDSDATIYGLISTPEGGVANVVVSDGENVTVTDKDGVYQLNSSKRLGYVFISIPRGYEVPSVGVLPQFHHSLKGDATILERVDFSLTKIENPDVYKVFFLGDMHLANRTNDRNQFFEFTSDLNEYRTSHTGKMYAISLGDMTWDLYWYSNNYVFEQYLSDINSKIQGLQLFHTMGNHDNDYLAKSDYDASIRYVSEIAPTFYSFNLGKVHYVVLDDIDCSQYDGTTSRNYVKGITSEQLSWLAKDLSYVDKSTPIILTTHAQIFYPASAASFTIDHDSANTQTLFNVLKGYKVHFVTGHTHMIFNVTPQETIVGGNDFQEHNAGSVCASWWWSGNLTEGVHISLDGAPGGYSIWDVSHTDFKWIYKATGWPESYQFRSYDLNNVHFSMQDVPLMPSTVSTSVKNDYMQYVNAYPENQNNEVLINIWNWNIGWTLRVEDERGNVLTPTAVEAYDPLHIAALSVKRFNNAKLSSTPSFITKKFVHFFKVKASDAETDLKISVTDEFGNTWSENMERPKAFSIDEYKKK
jgi:hypothetical protein